MEVDFSRLNCRLRLLGVVSDDISLNLLYMRLVSVAALLRRYSPSFHPSAQVAHSRSTNHDLLSIRFCRAKVVNSTRLCSVGPSRLPRNLNGIPTKMYLSNLNVDSSPHGVALALAMENVLSCLP